MLIAGYPHKMSKDEMTAKMNSMVKEVNTNLGMLSGVYAEHSNIVYYGDAIGKPDQARVLFGVRKEGRKTTWNDIMEAVNKVYAPSYKFQNF